MVPEMDQTTHATNWAGSSKSVCLCTKSGLFFWFCGHFIKDSLLSPHPRVCLHARLHKSFQVLMEVRSRCWIPDGCKLPSCRGHHCPRTGHHLSHSASTRKDDATPGALLAAVLFRTLFTAIFLLLLLFLSLPLSLLLGQTSPRP